MGRPEVAKSSRDSSPAGVKRRVAPSVGALLAMPARWFRWLRWDRRETILAFFTLTIALVAIVGGLTLYGVSRGSRVYEGVRVAGVDVGGMTRAQARTALREPLAKLNLSPLTLTADGASYSIVPADSGLSFDLDATVERAYAVGRTEPGWKRVLVWSNALLHGRNVAPVYRVDEAVLNSVLATLASKVVVAPQDARVSMSADGGPAVVPEANGRAVDVTATRTMLVNQFAQLTRAPVAIVMPVLTPVVTSAQLEGGAASAREAIAGSFTISGPESQAWELGPADLAGVISVSHDGEMQLDQGAIERLVDGLASSIERSSQNALVYVNDSDQIVVQPAVTSIEVDREGSLAAITSALLEGGRSSALVTTSHAPAILDDQARAAAAEAEALVANGMPLTWKGGTGALTRRELLAALTIAVDPTAEKPFAFGFDHGVLGSVLQPLFDDIAVKPQNAQLRMVNGEIKIEAKAQDGIAVAVDQSVQNVIEAAINHEKSAMIITEVAKPAFGDVKTSEIKLPDTLASSSTYYGESSEPRRNNVEQAARLENGWLVAPGDTFSFVEHVGGVSEKEGFVVGFGIVDNGQGGVTTAPVVGGGVCQMSTTIFQAAFWAGLPIVERYTHPYWITTYGQPPTGFLGLDAMINVEKDYSLDLKFTNSTGNWIAVVTEADGVNLTAKILGTNPGWTVSVSDPVITDIQQPSDEMQYEESSELPAGQELQVEHAAQGFTSTFTRVVKDGESVVSDDTFTGTYAPSSNTTLRGTGGQ